MSIAAHEEALARLLGEPIEESITLEITQPKQVRPQFYAHVDKKLLKILAISPQPIEQSEDAACLKIDYELAEKFIIGTENVSRWVVVFRDDQYMIMSELSIQREKLERVNDMQAFEITSTPDRVPYPDVVIEVGAEPDAVLIHFNGENISKWPRPAKLYFTAEGDPSHLKCAFTLSVNNLNEIAGHNNLEEWPNPIALKLESASDISVYSIRSGIKMAIKRHEATNN